MTDHYEEFKSGTSDERPTLSGPALAEALARLVGVEVGRVNADRAFPGTVRARLSDDVTVSATQYESSGIGVYVDIETGAEADDIASAAASALARLRAGYAAVCDVLDPWREGPPGEDGWYLVEMDEHDATVLGGTCEPAALWVGRLAVAGDDRSRPWPTVAGRPARYRALHMSAPPTA